eukprot:52199-Chlamydomonas_euryale.AAC.2
MRKSEVKNKKGCEEGKGRRKRKVKKGKGGKETKDGTGGKKVRAHRPQCRDEPRGVLAQRSKLAGPRVSTAARKVAEEAAGGC